MFSLIRIVVLFVFSLKSLNTFITTTLKLISCAFDILHLSGPIVVELLGFGGDMVMGVNDCVLYWYLLGVDV